MLLNAQQLALEILSNMCCPDGEIAVRVVQTSRFVIIYYSSYSELCFCTILGVPNKKNVFALQKECLKKFCNFQWFLKTKLCRDYANQGHPTKFHTDLFEKKFHVHNRFLPNSWSEQTAQ